MRTYALANIALLLLLPACSVLKAEENAAKAGVILDEVKTRLTTVDANKDGKVSWTEGLLGILGLTGAAGSVLASRKGAAIQTELDELWTETHKSPSKV